MFRPPFWWQLSFRVLYLYIIIIYDWITIMRYSKHEVSTINMLYSLKNVSYFNTTLHPHNGHLSTTVNGHFFLSSRWPVGERFDYKPKLVKPTNQNALISIGNSMICSDISYKYHEWYFEIVIRNRTAREIWDNFEISRVVYMPNITYKLYYYLFILLPAKGL